MVVAVVVAVVVATVAGRVACLGAGGGRGCWLCRHRHRQYLWARLSGAGAAGIGALAIRHVEAGLVSIAVQLAHVHAILLKYIG